MSERCKVPGCRNGTQGDDHFCNQHAVMWLGSHERGRAISYRNNASMLFAFARRMELDGFALPGLKHRVDQQREVKQ